MARRQLRVVRLIEPELCVGCRFGKIADVETQDGATQRMIRCQRLDCDNWDTQETEPVVRMEVHEERH